MNDWKMKLIDRPDANGMLMVIFRIGSSSGHTEYLRLSDYSTVTVKAGEDLPASIGIHFDLYLFSQLVDLIHGKYKPTEGKFTEGELEATKKHLEDMRTLLKLKKIKE